MKTKDLTRLFRAIKKLPVYDLANIIADDNRARFHGAIDGKANPHHPGPWKWSKLINLPREVLIGEVYHRARLGGSKIEGGKFRLSRAHPAEIALESERQDEFALTQPPSP